ncbi:helix-turn-helix domain-containing protein [Mumia sp. Pv 4-285]|uniref:helix-turn-helix domain-containing protein n=1 Tax=Mumia qirimensis TaxID=3234852 RepID=UPI00351D2295
MTDRLETDRLDGGERAPDVRGAAGVRDEVLEVRRSAGALALVAAGAGALALLYAVRAVDGSPVLWLVVLALAVLAAFAGRGWWDGRSPLLVADNLGVRFRHGRDWRGLPWEAVDHVLIDEPSGILRDGALEVVATDGTAYVVPLGLAVRASHEDLPVTLAALSGDDQLVVRPQASEPTPPPVPPVEARSDRDPSPVPPVEAASPSPVEAASPSPVEARSDRDPTPVSAPARIDLGLVQSAGTSALAPGFKVVTALRASHGRPELVLDRPVEMTPAPTAKAAPAQPQETEAEPAPEPETETTSLGAMLRASRERVGVTVDDLAARTRIRPHVIEALEDDDTSACGGDFYARGHLRAIARVLGADPAPWISAYDASYAQAPIPARAVFEAERSTGSRTIRVARGGRSWVALTVVVLVLAIIWGIGQLVVGGEDGSAPATVPTEAAPAPADPSALAGLGAPTTNHLVIRGKEKKPTKVAVTDSRGTTIWSGDLAKGEFRRVSVVGPATVTAGRGDAATVAVNGGKAHRLGDSAGKARATLGDS